MRAVFHATATSLGKRLAYRLLQSCTKEDAEAFLRHKSLADGDTCILEALVQFAGLSTGRCPLLDVGGGDGSFLRSFLGSVLDQFEISVLDIHDSGQARFINHDVTKPVSDEYANRFDIVFSYNTFEHLTNPLMAADNICKLVRPGGLVAVHTVFFWRYHPVPKDYFRFSDDALKHLFAERNNLVMQRCAYDIGRRRENIGGGFFEDKDIPPIDWLGGFRENWEVFFIGRRPTAVGS